MQLHTMKLGSFQPEFQWLSVVDFSSFVFRVQACQNVELRLAETIGSSDIQITIGAQNAISYITYGEHVIREDTPNILNCDEYRTFYVRWTGSTIGVGTGSGIYYNQIIAYSDAYQELPLTNVISLMNTRENVIDYQIFKYIGK